MCDSALLRTAATLVVALAGVTDSAAQFPQVFSVEVHFEVRAVSLSAAERDRLSALAREVNAAVASGSCIEHSSVSAFAHPEERGQQPEVYAAERAKYVMHLLSLHGLTGFKVQKSGDPTMSLCGGPRKSCVEVNVIARRKGTFACPG